MASEKTTPQTKAIPYKKSEDFEERYSNNVLLESSLWDLRLIFGKLDQQVPGNVIDQFCAITLPWAQAKVLHYFLGIHLAGHELHNGRVQIPTGIIPAVPDSLTADFASDPKSQEIHDVFKAAYDEFIAENPEAK